MTQSLMLAYLHGWVYVKNAQTKEINLEVLPR
jgi:hypothetical protein